MKVLGKKILLIQEKTGTVTAGGIALPEQTVTKLPRGEVTHTGEDCETIKVGDRVAVNDVAAIIVHVNDQEYCQLEEDDVILILEEGDN